MEIKDFSLVLGTGAAAIWILKVIATKLIDKFFKQAEQLEEMRDSHLHQKINRISDDMEKLSLQLKHSSEESIRLKITIQSLIKEISGVSNDLKLSNSNTKETVIKLIDVLKSMQSQIKSHGLEIESFGRILMRLPEDKK
jgi:archaellum component FlaC